MDLSSATALANQIIPSPSRKSSVLIMKAAPGDSLVSVIVTVATGLGEDDFQQLAVYLDREALISLALHASTHALTM